MSEWNVIHENFHGGGGGGVKGGRGLVGRQSEGLGGVVWVYKMGLKWQTLQWQSLEKTSLSLSLSERDRELELEL